MAQDRRRKGGRVTPKGGASGTGGASDGTGGAGRSGSGSTSPDGSPTPTGQVGKRPSPPVFLLVVAVLWIACGIAAFFIFKATWRIVVGVVFIGIGLYWLRGALATVSRHEERLDRE